MTGARFDRPNPYLFASYAVLDPGWDEHLGHLEIEGMGMITFYYTLLAIGLRAKDVSRRDSAVCA